ncbi:MAG: MarR family transcriptional regulator [Rhodospirillales bacterium]|nr:MarR family transcriptional regulator [Rhodospirillales bacterium]
MADAESPEQPAHGGAGAKGKSRRPAKSGAPINMGMLPDLIGYHLRCAQVTVFQHYSTTMGKLSISAPQFGTLLLIESNPGISQSSVAEALRFDRSTLVQIIDRLESRDLVVREVSAQDRRSHALRLTSEGAKLLAQLKEIALQHEEDIAHRLSAEERATLMLLLDRVHSSNSD